MPAFPDQNLSFILEQEDITIPLRRNTTYFYKTCIIVFSSTMTNKSNALSAFNCLHNSFAISLKTPLNTLFSIDQMSFGVESIQREGIGA